jgi:hypothetical protein
VGRSIVEPRRGDAVWVIVLKFRNLRCFNAWQVRDCHQAPQAFLRPCHCRVIRIQSPALSSPVAVPWLSEGGGPFQLHQPPHSTINPFCPPRAGQVGHRAVGRRGGGGGPPGCHPGPSPDHPKGTSTQAQRATQVVRLAIRQYDTRSSEVYCISQLPACISQLHRDDPMMIVLALPVVQEECGGHLLGGYHHRRAPRPAHRPEAHQSRRPARVSGSHYQNHVPACPADTTRLKTDVYLTKTKWGSDPIARPLDGGDENLKS